MSYEGMIHREVAEEFWGKAPISILVGGATRSPAEAGSEVIFAVFNALTKPEVLMSHFVEKGARSFGTWMITI